MYVGVTEINFVRGSKCLEKKKKKNERDFFKRNIRCTIQLLLMYPIFMYSKGTVINIAW